MDYVMADPHFGHQGILSENNCNRPFDSLHEMNKTIIDNINEVVKKKDTLYILGDFTYRCGLEKVIHYRSLINCDHIILILGNHDMKYCNKKRFRDLFEKIETRIFYKGFGMEIVLDHYALLTWPKSHYGVYHLFGHSHGKLTHPNPRAMDVGVDCWDFKPLSMVKIKDIFEKRLKEITIKKIEFMSQSEAEGIIPKQNEAIISISCPKDVVHLSNLWRNKLELKFHDIDFPEDDKVIFNEDHYDQIMNFLNSIENSVENIVVHCHAGISRSAAVAMFIADIYRLNFNTNYTLYNKYIYTTCKKLYYKNKG